MSQDIRRDASRTALHAPLIAMTTALFALGACGGSDAPAGSDTGETDAAEEREPGMINSFTLDVEGTDVLVPTPPPADIQLVGGCDRSNPMQFTFYASTPQAEDWFSLSFDTVDIVDGGETGTFEVTDLEWANGVFRPDNLPEGVNVKVPDQFSGTGTLELTRHVASISSRRMAGTITGHVESENSDEAADLTASFDINWSCAVF